MDHKYVLCFVFAASLLLGCVQDTPLHRQKDHSGFVYVGPSKYDRTDVAPLKKINGPVTHYYFSTYTRTSLTYSRYKDSEGRIFTMCDNPCEPEPTEHFIFEENRTGSYSLKTTDDSTYITKDTRYVKTFGGMPPTIRVDVINDQFIVFPETLEGTEDPKKIFHPMTAVTHIYDLSTGKIVFTSEPYIYDHDVPLVYDFHKFID